MPTGEEDPAIRGYRSCHAKTGTKEMQIGMEQLHVA